MKAKEIRNHFLEFFNKKEHEIVSSAPMVVKNDPTLMFINAGMNQFKDLFLGNSKIKYPRIADTQKCLRVSGKHNDLEEVGVDTYHHTMFEMLGNWSFGDYFKKEAIEWAWELLTEVYKIDKDRLYVTVFEGDQKDGLNQDQEAYDIWKNMIAEDRIILASKKDNFWEMGDVGPCGPCSEIHVDVRSDEERKQVDGKTLVNMDHPQVIEVWNLVFMQFNRKANGELVKLPAQHVDTGMGFERLAMVLQGKKSNYDTDIFQPLINQIEKIASYKYTFSDDKKDIAVRVIADHIRAIAFSIADGQLPSNTGAGYVIRRILRRAVRYAYSFLDVKEAFIYQLQDVLKDEMGDAFPELVKQNDLIKNVIKEEEDSFLRTLEKGINRFNDYISSTKSKTIDGKFAFELFDTYGFPIDLTQLIASEHGLSVDMADFEGALTEQKERSRKATAIETDDWVELIADEKEEFIGYEYTETTVKITKYRKVSQKGKDLYQVVFNLTPFYPEGGGQVGDTGYIESNEKKWSIIDTKKENNQIIHFMKELPADVTVSFQAVVSKSKRDLTANNHSATHLLHEALRDVLGTHVEQKGSLVNEKYLRFDFSHFSKLTDEELAAIEKQVNENIKANFALEEKRNVPMSTAKEMGAMALFGEKYGDTVRVIKFGSSVELCGGIHVNSTSKIGLFKITAESSIASGIRRIEAITADAAINYYQQKETVVNELNELLKKPKNMVKAVSDLQDENKKLKKQLEALQKEQAKAVKAELLNGVEQINGVDTIIKKVDLDPNSIKDIIFQVKGKRDNIMMVIGTAYNGKPNLSVFVSDDLIESKGLNAGNIVRDLAKEIQGGGGGQAFFASAGGKNPEGIEAALVKAKEIL